MDTFFGQVYILRTDLLTTGLVTSIEQNLSNRSFGTIQGAITDFIFLHMTVHKINRNVQEY